MNNQWARISNERWVHPHIGNILFFNNKWEATPRSSYNVEMQKFPTFIGAKEWMEVLYKVHSI